MDKKTRPGASDQEQEPDGPLTRLIDEETGPLHPGPLRNRLPRPPETKPTGRDDYASGTSEHDDDRES